MDGSNATIVGNLPGEFRADRNSIPRVWMDHGAWPLITTKLYLDLTGNLRISAGQAALFS
jgi:cellobiose phosphorylase